MKRFTDILSVGRCAAILLILFCAASAAFSQANFQSNATGNWGTASTWTIASGTDADGIPDADDNVEIVSGHTVTVNTASACNNLTITSGIVVVPNQSFTVNGTTTLNGEIRFTSTIQSKTFQSVIINSGGNWNSTAGETYAINGNLTLNGGTLGGTATGILNVSGNVSVSSGSTNTLGRATVTVTGTTQIDGTLNITSATGTKTFVGKITINNGGEWNNATGNSPVALRGGIQNDGTFTSGTGTYTFSTNSQTISGTNGLTFSATGTSISISGAITVTNQTTVTAAGNITGSVGGSTWLNDAGSTLNVAGTMLTTGTLNAAAIPNTVNYNGTGTQTIKAANYNNLTISNDRTTNNVTFANGGTVGISGTLTLDATFTTGNYVTTNNTINFNGSGTQTIPPLGTANYNNLTRSGTGTASLSDNVGVAGNLTVSGGTLDLGAFTANRTAAGGTLTVGAGATLRIGGTNTYPANYTTNTLNAASTVEYYGSTQTISATPTYGNLTLSGTGPKTTPSGTTTTTVAGNFTLNAGIDYERASGATSTLTLNGTTNVNNGSLGTLANPFNTINVGNAAADNLTNNGTVVVATSLAGTGSLTQGVNSSLYIGGTFTTTTVNLTAVPNLVEYNGTGAQTVRGTNYYNLTISGDRTTNNVTFASGATVGIANILNPAATFTTGNYVTTNNTVEFNGTADQTVPFLGTVNYNNLTFNKASGTAKFSGSLSLDGNLTVTAGTLDLETNTANRATAGGTLTLGATGTLRIGGTNGFPSNYTTNTLNTTSTVEYYGSTQTIAATPTYGNLTLSGSGPKTTPTGTTTTTVAGNFTLNTGITYEQEAGATATLTLNGTTNTNDGTLGSVANPFTTINVGNAVTDNLTNNNAINTGALAITGSLTNNGTVIASGNLSGTGTFTQNATALLYIGGNATITTLNASADPNTVTYNGTAAQSIAGATYHNLVVANNPATASLAANATVNNDFTIASGATASIGASTFVVNGLTEITGTLNITSTTGTKTFNDLTVVGGGVFSNSANEAVTINGNIVNDGTFTSGTGVYTLAGSAKTLSGSSALTIESADISGSYTNEMTFTATTALTGTGVFTNGTGATFNLGNTAFGAPTFTVATFNASAAGNTVDYLDISAQTVRVPSDGAYHHLKASTLGAKTAAGDLSVNGDLTIQGFATFNGGTSRTHTFYGNWLVNTSAGTPFGFTTSSTIRFMTPSPAASTSISGSSASVAFNNLEINNTSAVEVFINITASGNLTVGSGATIIPFESITVGGTGTLTGSGSVKVTRTAATPDFLSQYTIANRDLSALTVDYDASGAQSINTLNYFNLIIRGVRGANTVTLNSGTIGVSGTFSPIASFTSGNYSTTGNTVDFNGTGAQSIPAFDYNNLTISNARTTANVTLASSGTIGIAGTFSPTATFTTGGYVVTGSTIDYNGSGNQSVATFDYHNLTLSTGGTKTFNSGTNRIAGTFTINSPATADAITNSSTIEYNGTSTQTTPGVDYTHLTISNASGILLSGDASVAGTLTFTNGNITTGSNTISMTSTGTVSRTNGHVVGNFRKFIPTGSPSQTFEVGTGSNYTPVDITFASVTTSGTLTVKTTGTDHPQILLSGIDPAKSVNRYWTLTNSGIAFSNYDVTFTFVAGDVDGPADPNQFIVSRYESATWNLETVGTKTATSTQATGLTGFGDFQLGEPSAAVVKTWDGGAGTNHWGDGLNWNPDGVPSNTDDVYLSGAVTIDINVAAVANDMTMDDGGLTLTILNGNSLTLDGDLTINGGTLNTHTTFPTVVGTINITGGTVGYTASSGSQTVAALSYNNVTLSGAGTRTFAAGTTQIAGTFTISGPTVNTTTNNSTIDFNGGAQTVPAINYYNLTLSSTGVKTLASGTVGIANTFTISGLASVDATTNSTTVNYNGSGSQTVLAVTYHHLSLSNSGTKTLAAGTTQLRGDFTVSGATADLTTNSTTVTFNSSGAQSVAAVNYYNITFANAGTKTFAAGTSGIANVFTITGSATADATANSTTIEYNGSSSQNVAQIDYHHLTLTNDGVKTFASGTTNIAGNFTINTPASANVTTNSATIAYNGTALQTTPVLTYVGVTINNAAGIQLSGDVSVAGTLTFTSGNIYTGSNKITITSTGTVSRTSGHVVGNLEKYYPLSFGAIARTFEIGDASTYSPVLVSFNAVFTAGYLIASTAAGDHPQIVTSGIDPLKSVNRTWTLTNNGILPTTYSATFNFVAGDIDGGADFNNFIVSRYSGGAWTQPTVGTRTSTSTEVTGVTAFGDFQIGEPGSASIKTWDGGAGTNNWGDGNNWSPNGVPTASDNVNLNGAFTINVDIAAVGNSITLNHAGLTLTILSGNSLTASGTLTITTGTLNTQADFPSAASVVISGGTVGYTASSGSQTVSALDYNNLVISGGGTKTLAGSGTVAGDLTVSGGTFDLSTFTIDRTTAGGTLTLASGAALKIGGTNPLPQNYSTHSIDASSTIEYGGSDQSIVSLNSSQDYGNLTISGSGTKSLSATIGVRGDLTVSAGTFDVGVNAVDRTSPGGTMTIGNGATLRIGGTGTIPANYATHAIGSTSTIEYAGTNQSVVALNSLQNYGTLVIAGSATKTLASDITIAGDLTVSSSTFDLGTNAANRTSSGGILTVGASGTLLLSGSSGGISGSNFPSNFSTVTLTGIVEYNGASQQTIAPFTYSTLTLSNTGEKVIDASVTVNNPLTINSGIALTIDPTGTLTVNADLNNDGTVTNNGTLLVGSE